MGSRRPLPARLTFHVSGSRVVKSPSACLRLRDAQRLSDSRCVFLLRRVRSLYPLWDRGADDAVTLNVRRGLSSPARICAFFGCISGRVGRCGGAIADSSVLQSSNGPVVADSTPARSTLAKHAPRRRPAVRRPRCFVPVYPDGDAPGTQTICLFLLQIARNSLLEY